jgi:lipid-binding SYLF domain-containing protein
MRKFSLLFVVGILATPIAAFASDERLKATEQVLIEMSESQDRGIPTDLIMQAKCIVIVPGVKKGALGVGGQYGRGYMSCHRPDNNHWSAPAGVRIEGGSFGLQIGGSETDVVLIVKNQAGVDRLLSNQFTIGADAAVAAGPLGRQASAQTDATMRAEMLAYSHSRGVFAGVALQGATLREDGDENKTLYGTNIDNRDIVAGKVPPPAGAAGLMAALAKY